MHPLFIAGCSLFGICEALVLGISWLLGVYPAGMDAPRSLIGLCTSELLGASLLWDVGGRGGSLHFGKSCVHAGG